MTQDGHLEFLDIDRETITTDLTPNSIAVRFVNTSEVGTYGGHVQYGRWDPTENAVIVAGCILHKKEFEENKSPKLTKIIEKACETKIDRLNDELVEQEEELLKIQNEIASIKKDLKNIDVMYKSVSTAGLNTLITLASRLNIRF